MKRVLSYILLAAMAMPAVAETNNAEPLLSTKQERNYITEGNKLYRDKRFADAEVSYRKALELVPGSEIASYNLAAALIRQAGSADPNAENNPLKDAQQLLQQLAAGARDISIAEKAFYNLGNMAFNQENYAQAIDMYKNSLRKNPDNDKTRENLRLAQIKLKEQQQNQDKNQNQQDKQDQQDKQNQDQNKNDDKNQQKDDQQQNQQQEQEKDKKPEQQPRQETSISDANAEKILKAMENEEAATRRRVEAQKKKSDKNSSRRQVTNPW